MSLKRICMILSSLPKTIYFNFKYFPLKQAIKLPVLISRNTYLMETKGQVIVENPKTFGVKMGFGEVGIFDNKKSRSVWQVKGKIIFKGSAEIGHGSKLTVSGDLVIGNNFAITAESSIACHKKVQIGENVLVSWENLIMDTDFHNLLNKDGEKTNPDVEVIIGNNVWIGCRCTVLKGANIPNGSVVAANSVVSKNFRGTDCILIAGNPARISKGEVSWSR